MNLALVILATALASAVFSLIIISFVPFPLSVIICMVGGYGIGLAITNLFLDR